MPRPILLVTLPTSNMPEAVAAINAHLAQSSASEEYHILVITGTTVDGNIQFQCINAPHTETDFEDFKQQVLTMLECPVIEAGTEIAACEVYELAPQAPVDEERPYSPTAFAYRQLGK